MANSDPWFDRYNFVQPIGEGGMGSVYYAEDRSKDNRPCVVKQIKTASKSLAEQAEMTKVFIREAEFLAKLNHRGIVKFIDDHFSEEGMFLVMEHVPGDNLDVVVRKEGTLTSDAVVRIAIQCCDVLDYLHAFEPAIIYRDLKPSNLILRPDGLVVFVDFGIARDFEPQGPATRVITSGYSPPEQYFGKPEPRGDLYSLGATMFHLLTGKRPRPLNACNPRSVNEYVLPSLSDLVLRLTSHEVDKRPASARAVQTELFYIYKEMHPEFEIPYGDTDSNEDILADYMPEESDQKPMWEKISAWFKGLLLKVD
ncbi:MAG: serine/threonine protein kinase [Candidatus Obscuribacterales bacterium]|nr:serine/threonine protein kinase [Candidatus Obscuribacterales bacterium]